MAAVVDWGTINIWEVASGRVAAIRETYLGFSLAWDPGGLHLAFAGQTDYSSGVGAAVRIWDADTGALLRSLRGHPQHINAVSWSPDGRYLASGSDDRAVRLWGVRPAEQE